MKKIFKSALALVCFAMLCSCTGKKSERITEGDTKTMDSLSYCLGANIGLGLKQQFTMQFGELNFNLESVTLGLTEGITNTSHQSHEDAVDLLREYFAQTIGERHMAYQQAVAEDPEAKFNAFADADECSKISYALGNDIGNNLRSSKLYLQYYWLGQGISAAWDGSLKMERKEIMDYLQHYFMVVLPAEAEARSKEWIEEKKSEWGTKSTESGLVYKIIDEGDMSKAAKNDEDVVKVHYVGKLQDGTVFDASRFENRSPEQQEMIRQQQPMSFDENGKFTADEPIEFPLNRVIAGWTEGMKLVGPGGKIKLYIPAELAYGRRGAGNNIGPNEALEFEVELLEVTPAVVEEPSIEESAVRPLPAKE